MEYVQFSIGGMSGSGGLECVREVFESALTAVGLHFTRGAALWEAYREFENAVLAGLQVSRTAARSRARSLAYNHTDTGTHPQSREQ